MPLFFVKTKGASERSIVFIFIVTQETIEQLLTFHHRTCKKEDGIVTFWGRSPMRTWRTLSKHYLIDSTHQL